MSLCRTLGILLPVTSLLLPPLVRAQAPATPPIELSEALHLAVARNPSLKVFAARARAALARRTDAGRFSNPDLSITSENLGIDGRVETSLTLSQRLDLGGLRGARLSIARALALQASYELSSAERAVVVETAERFLDVWELQERAGLMARGVALADEAISVASARFRAGAAPEVERIRAEGQKAARAAEARKLITELHAARRLLALQWLGTPAVDSVSLPSPEGWSVPLADSLLAHLGAHPDQLAAAAGVAVEEARLREARSARVPDLSVEGGLKRLQETGSVGMVAGLTLSLPIWNPGRGAVKAAAAEQEAALASQEAARATLSAELERASARLTGALGSLAALRQEVTPRSQEALLQIENGYRAGRFSYLDLADAQRALIEAETATIAAASEAWRARAVLSRISGEPLLQPDEGGSK